MSRIVVHGASFDHTTMADAFAGPGMDTRQWISYGLVDGGPEGVAFDTDDGQPYIHVILQPSGIPVRARVASQVAGNGEGEHFPFVHNDEVLCVIPEGDEAAGVAIIGRLNNVYDAFPQQVAGQDATGNTFGFRRIRTPYIIETASSYMIRSAVSGSFLSIDPTGSFTVADGNSNMLHIGADFIGLAAGDNSTLLQLDFRDHQVVAEANGANGGSKLTVDPAASTFQTSGTLAIGTAGLPATGHAITAEQVINIMTNFLIALAPYLATPGGLQLPGAPLSPIGFPAPLVGFLTQVIESSVAPIPPTAATGGGVSLPGIPQAIMAALAAQVPDLTGQIPGIGKPGFTL